MLGHWTNWMPLVRRSLPSANWKLSSHHWRFQLTSRLRVVSFINCFVLCNNQYPTNFYEPLIHSTIEKLHLPQRSNEAEKEEVEEVPKHLLFLQFRGKVTEEYVRALNKLNAPCKVILTLRKLKTVMPSLKVAVDKSFKSRVVYKLLCSRCQACYVGQTDQHLVKRFKQHCQPSQPFGKHIRLCGVSPVFDDKKDVSVLHITTRSIPFLEALEAFWIREICPTINTKDEYKRRELTIKL